MPFFCSPLFSGKNPHPLGNGWLGATPRVMRSLASLASIGRDESDYFGCLCLTRQRCHEDTRCGVCGSELGRDGVWCQVFFPPKITVRYSFKRPSRDYSERLFFLFLALEVLIFFESTTFLVGRGRRFFLNKWEDVFWEDLCRLRRRLLETALAALGSFSLFTEVYYIYMLHLEHFTYVHIYHQPSKPTFLEVFVW